MKTTHPHSPSLVAPFGRGRRMCPGKRFVDLELHLLLAKVCTITDIIRLVASYVSDGLFAVGTDLNRSFILIGEDFLL